MDREALVKLDWLLFFSLKHGVANSDWRLVPHLRKIKAILPLKNLKQELAVIYTHRKQTKTSHFVLCDIQKNNFTLFSLLTLI